MCSSGRICVLPHYIADQQTLITRNISQLCVISLNRVIVKIVYGFFPYVLIFILPTLS